MTDMVRIFDRREDERKVLGGVSSAIETKVGVLVEFNHPHDDYGTQNHFEGYDLVGFGR